MARGALRGAATAWLGLIALQALTSKSGADPVGGIFDTLNGIVQHALSPDVAAIPDHSKAAADSNAGTPAAALGGFTPEQFAAALAGLPAAKAFGQQAGTPGTTLNDLLNLNQVGVGNLAALQGLTPTK